MRLHRNTRTTTTNYIPFWVKEETMDKTYFSDQDIMNDILSTQKFITGGYNTNANESAEPTVKNAMMSILDEEHTIQHDVFLEMQKRGWYQTEAAPQQKVDDTKQKFCNSCNC